MPVININFSIADRENMELGLENQMTKNNQKSLSAAAAGGMMAHPVFADQKVATLYFQCDTAEEQDAVIAFIKNNNTLKLSFPAFKFDPKKYLKIAKNIVAVSMTEYCQKYSTGYSSDSDSSSDSQDTSLSHLQSGSSLDDSMRDFIFFIESSFSGLVEEFLSHFKEKNNDEQLSKTSLSLADIIHWAKKFECFLLPNFSNPYEAQCFNYSIVDYDHIAETTLSDLKKESLSILKKMQVVPKNAAPEEIDEHRVYNEYLRRGAIGSTIFAARAGYNYQIGGVVSSFFHNVTLFSYHKEYTKHCEKKGETAASPQKEQQVEVRKQTNTAQILLLDAISHANIPALQLEKTKVSEKKEEKKPVIQSDQKIKQQPPESERTFCCC